MRELGRKGGKSSGGVKPEHVPPSLREELRKLDPAIVRGAIEQALAGGNERARVGAVKVLADLKLYRKDECLACAQREAQASIVVEAVPSAERAEKIFKGLAEIGLELHPVLRLKRRLQTSGWIGVV